MDELDELTTTAAAELIDPRVQGRALVNALVQLDEEQRRLQIAAWRQAAAAGIGFAQIAAARLFLLELLGALPYVEGGD